MTPIQEKLLSMLSWFHDFCVANNIRYYAAGGTVIGAMRHKGFIPWDDDVDVVVPRDDYNRLIRLFNKKIDHYILESPYTGNNDYLYAYAKLYDIDTTLIEKAHFKCRRGIYIDVFPLDGIGMSIEEATLNFNKVDRKNMLLMTRTCALQKDRSIYKNLAIILSRLVPNVFLNNKLLCIKIDQLACKIHTKDSRYVANLMGTYRSREIVEADCFGKPILSIFENIQIYCPENYDKYLGTIYGNWRELPPKEKRCTKHNYVEFDLNKPYMN